METGLRMGQRLEEEQSVFSKSTSLNQPAKTQGTMFLGFFFSPSTNAS